MSVAEALFLRAGDHYLPTEHAIGPHDPARLAGGAVAALASFAIRAKLRRGARIGRVTTELLRAVPRRPLSITVEVVRAGRAATWLTARVDVDHEPVAITTAVALSAAADSGPVASVTRAVRWPGPLRSTDIASLAAIPAWNDGFFGGAVACHVDPAGSGIEAGWCVARLTMPVVAGSHLHPVDAAIAVADIAHGVGLPPGTAAASLTAINPDLTLAFSRDPAPGAVVIDVGESWTDGTGLARASLSDAGGVFAVGLQTQVVLAR